MVRIWAAVFGIGLLAYGQTEIDPAFFGTWTANIQGSRLASADITFARAGDELELTQPGRHYRFKLDDTEVDTGAPSRTASWKQTGRQVFDTTTKVNGKQAYTERREISADGTTMHVTIESHLPGMSGEMTWRRVSGDDPKEPLIGTWRLDQSSVKAAVPTVTIEPAAGGIHYRGGGEYTAQFDGREYPVTGAMAPAGNTVILKRIDSRTIETENRIDGRALSTTRMELSADGKSYVQTVTNLREANPPTVIRWEKQ